MTTIPPITCPTEKYWRQPKLSSITVDDVNAIMSLNSFYDLYNYSDTRPIGIYEGKMWKSKIGNDWYLEWYKNHDELTCDVIRRKIIVKEKVLSVKQPFAYLICAGIKDVENRTWKTKYRGRVLIHSSAKMNCDYPFELLTTKQVEDLGIIRFKDFMKDYDKVSSIIGSVEIVDCVINYDSVWAEKTEIPLLGDVLDDIKYIGYPVPPKVTYNWVLKDAMLFDNPITNVKGKLNIWDYKLPLDELR